MHTLEATKKIRAPLRDIWQLIWEIKSWAHFWEPVQTVDILYDDGIHQDFIMSLDWQNRDVRIRTVRFRDRDGNIQFFSPEPPSPTIIHQGMWKFLANEDDTTVLTTVRSFELPMVAKESIENYLQRLENLSEGFQARLEKLLERLGSACEK